MKLKKLMDLRDGDKIVAVGSGGKTTFCLNLCEELKEDGKSVIFTTTTKIYPAGKEYGFIDLTRIAGDRQRGEAEELENDEAEYFLRNFSFEKKMYLIGIYDRKIRKIRPLRPDLLEYVSGKADYTVIEGDGSKCRPLKGWNETEPVYVKNTAKSAGIIPVNCIGMKINGENIHRLDRFLKITGSAENGEITLDILKNAIVHKNGLFQYSQGKKYIILNCVETEKDFGNAVKLGKMLRGKIDAEIILASLKNRKYFKL